MLDLQKIKLLTKIVSIFLIAIFWILLIYLCLCFAFKIRNISYKIEIYTVILGYVSYGFRFIFDVIISLENQINNSSINWQETLIKASMTTAKKWELFFQLSLVIIPIATIYPPIMRFLLRNRIDGQVFPDYSNSPGLTTIQFINVFSLYSFQSFLRDLLQKREEGKD